MSVPTTLLVFFGYYAFMGIGLIIVSSIVLSFIASFFKDDKKDDKDK